MNRKKDYPFIFDAIFLEIRRIHSTKMAQRPDNIPKTAIELSPCNQWFESSFVAL